MMRTAFSKGDLVIRFDAMNGVKAEMFVADLRGLETRQVVRALLRAIAKVRYDIELAKIEQEEPDMPPEQRQLAAAYLACLGGP
jgi:acyl-CoA hydrolase